MGRRKFLSILLYLWSYFLCYQSCSNYTSNTIIILDYDNLLDAIYCHVPSIQIQEDIWIMDEILILNQTITITGDGTSKLIADTSRIFLIQNSDVIITNLTLYGGSISGSGGAIRIESSNVTFELSSLYFGSATSGGALSILDSSIVLNDTRIENNSATEYGGGIDCASSQLVISTSVISNNTATFGGSVASDYCQITLKDSSIVHSTGKKAGGCLYAILLSNVTIIESEISYCTIDLSPTGLNEASQGGCIFGSDIELSLKNTNISACFAAIGSAFRVTESKLEIIHSNINNNVALLSTMEILGTSSTISIFHSQIHNNMVGFSSSILCCGYGAHCVLSDTMIFMNQASFSAGITAQYNAVAEVRNCIFRENVAGSSGGALYSSLRSQVFLTNCTFENNSASQSGGACLIGDHSVLIVKDCHFNGNHANSGGSIMAVFGSTININQSSFIHDSASGFGGSVVLSGSSTATVYQSTFSNSEAVYGGALYANSYSTVLVINSEFSNCNALYEGGAISAYQHSNISIVSSDFIGNTAVYGGAMFAQLGTTFQLMKCSIQDNKATYMGGGVDVHDESQLYVEDSIFLDNNAKFYGAGISCLFSSLQVLQTHFERNNCDFDGGVIHSIFSTIDIGTSTFTLNHGLSGGALSCTSNSSCLSSNNRYESNSADFGGVISVSRSSLDSNSDFFVSNTATSGGIAYSTNFLQISFRNITALHGKSVTGGAMTLSNGGALDIYESVFVSNSAQNSGGALYLLYIDRVLLNRVIFSKNSAILDGGAVAIYGSLQVDPNDEENRQMKLAIENSNFTSNTVSRRGGAFYGNNILEARISHSQFSENKAAYGGAIFTAKSTGNISTSRFFSNLALSGGGAVYWLYEVNGPILTVDPSCIDDGNSAIYGPFKATDVYQLTASRAIDSEENSGSPIQNPVFVDMRDYYGQVVVDDIASELTGNVVYGSTADSFSSLQGSTIEQTTNGVATFGNFTVTYMPNSSVTLYFDMSSSVERAEYQIYFRPCVVGEIVLSLFGETTICSKCNPGYYSLKLNSEKCKLCPEHAICKGGNVIDVRPGYWRMGSEYDDVRLCLAKDACQGGDDPDKQCRKGHKGPYCSVCEDGYYKRGGVCLSCSSSGARLFMTLLPTICFLICLLLYYLWIIRDKFIHYFWNQAGVLAKKADKYHLTGLRTKFKILLAFVQIISQIPFALDVDFPQIYLQFLEILWIFNLDIVEFLNFECIYQRNFYDKLVEATLGPFILMGVILTVLLIRLGVAYRLNSLNPSYPYSQFRKEAIFCSLLLSFVVFSPVSIKVFQTFACEPFEDGSSRLIIDYTIHCSGDEYNFYVIYSIFMILIYPIGVPALYFTLLYMNHDQVNPPTRLVVRDSERHLVSNVIIQQEKIKLRNSYHEIFIISFLYIAYEPRRWYFEILDCFRRLMMTAVPVLIMRGAITQIIIVLLVSLSCIAAYMELKPYTTKSDNTVAVFSQWAITLTLIVAILLRIDEGTGLNRQTLGIIAILINSTVFVITVLLILFSDEEFNPTVEMENIERQTQINNNKRKKTSTMKLSHFIEKQSVEMIEKKNSEDETTEVSESSKSEKSQSSVSRKSGSISQRSMKAKIKETSEIDETEPKRVSSISFKNPDINILSKKRSSTNSEETEIRRESFDSSHTPNRGRLSRLVKRDEKDSDDESNSDDEQDSDDDTSNTTHNKRKPDKHPPGAVTNPLNQVHKNI